MLCSSTAPLLLPLLPNLDQRVLDGDGRIIFRCRAGCSRDLSCVLCCVLLCASRPTDQPPPHCSNSCFFHACFHVTTLTTRIFCVYAPFIPPSHPSSPGVRGEGDLSVERQPSDHFQPRIGRLAADDAHGGAAELRRCGGHAEAEDRDQPQVSQPQQHKHARAKPWAHTRERKSVRPCLRVELQS